MTPDTGSKQLLHDAALDRLIRQSPVVPPPAVGLHGLSSCDKSIGDLSKITLFKVVAEDESSGAYPACVETFGPQVILEHPVVTAWLGVQGCPDRGQVRNANWNPKTAYRNSRTCRLRRGPYHLAEFRSDSAPELD